MARRRLVCQTCAAGCGIPLLKLVAVRGICETVALLKLLPGSPAVSFPSQTRLYLQTIGNLPATMQAILCLLLPFCVLQLHCCESLQGASRHAFQSMGARRASGDAYQAVRQHAMRKLAQRKQVARRLGASKRGQRAGHLLLCWAGRSVAAAAAAQQAQRHRDAAGLHSTAVCCRPAAHSCLLPLLSASCRLSGRAPAWLATLA